jgi:hypothetical protein
MKVIMLLADAAQAADGKLFVLGGGWSLAGPGPTPMAIAIKVDVPWDRGNIVHEWKLELVDADGESVLVPLQPEGEPGPLQLQGAFEPGRPPGLRPGTPLDVVLAVNFGPLPLPPGARYEWRFSVNGFDDYWTVAFSTRPAPAPAPAPA